MINLTSACCAFFEADAFLWHLWGADCFLITGLCL
jgi:hypothetical protein